MSNLNQIVTEDSQYELLNNFYIENRDKGLLSKEDILKLCSNKFPFLFSVKESDEYKCVPYFHLIITPDLVDKIIFGFKNGLFFTSNGFYEIKTIYQYEFLSSKIMYYLYGPYPLQLIGSYSFSKQEIINEKDLNKKFFWILVNSKNEYRTTRRYFEDEIILVNRLIKIIHEKTEEEKRKKEERRIEILSLNKSKIISVLDKDGNGEVDLVDGESFNKLLTKNQKSIVEIDKNYIQKFVKISLYLKTKKSNTQKIFDSIKDTKNETELNELISLLKNQIHTYELLVFHSISMITSLVESDLITFYEIYECFDQLGVFNSNWENEVSNKLTDIGDGIKDLMYSIYQMENKIVNSIDNLTYVTQDSFEELNNSVNKQLSSIDSSIKYNNLLTGIQTYQMYKINQNTKRIN
jgi:hypothetical protein